MDLHQVRYLVDLRQVQYLVDLDEVPPQWMVGVAAYCPGVEVRTRAHRLREVLPFRWVAVVAGAQAFQGVVVEQSQAVRAMGIPHRQEVMVA